MCPGAERIRFLRLDLWLSPNNNTHPPSFSKAHFHVPGLLRKIFHRGHTIKVRKISCSHDKQRSRALSLSFFFIRPILCCGLWLLFPSFPLVLVTLIVYFLLTNNNHFDMHRAGFWQNKATQCRTFFGLLRIWEQKSIKN